MNDTWHVDGMAATGSRDIVASAVYVPERAGVAARRLEALAGRGDDYLGRIPVLPLLSLTAAIPRSAPRGERSSCSGGCWPSAFRSARASARASARPRRSASRTRLADVRAAETVLRAVARDLTAHARGGTAALAHGPDPDAAHDRPRGARTAATSCAT